MPEYTIVETVHMTVEAPNAQEALDRWLGGGDEVVTSFAVEERDVLDANGEPCSVVDP